MREQKFLHKIKSNIWIYVGLILVFLLVFSSIVFDDFKLSFTNIMYAFPPFSSQNVAIDGPLLSDVVDQNYTVFFNYIHDFTFTFWNPQAGIGVPQSMWFFLFPLHYLFLLPLDIGIFLFSLSKFLIGFIGMYLLVREYGANKSSSFIAGIIFTFSSILVYWHGWPHTSVAILAPFMFLLTEKFFKTMKLKYLFLLSALTYFSLVAGMPTYTAYFLYLLGLYVLVYTIKNFKNDKRKMMIIFVCFFIAIMVAAVASLPYTGDLLTSVGSNGYADSRKYQATRVLNFEHIRSMIFPTIRSAGMEGHVNEGTMYTGILAVLLFPFSLINRKEKRTTVFWFVTSVVLLLLIFTGVFDVVFTRLPMINTSAKPRVIVLLNFSLAILTGLNLNDLMRNATRSVKKKLGLIACLGIGFVLFLVAANTLGVFSELDPERQTEFYRIYLVLIGSSMAIAAALFSKSKKLKGILVSIVSLLVIWDMGTFTKEYLPMIDKSADVIPEPTDTIKYMQENTKNQEKIAMLGNWNLFPSTNVFYGIRDIRGHDFAYTNEELINYYKAIDKTAYDSPTRISFNHIDNINLLKYLGVKYISTNSLTTLDDRYADTSFVPTLSVYKGHGFEQEFTATVQGLSQMTVLVGTSDYEFGENDTLTFEIIDRNMGSIASQTTTKVKGLRNNAPFTFKFPSIDNSLDKDYVLRVSSNLAKEMPMAFYTTEEQVYDGEIFYGNEEISGSLILAQTNAEETYYGKDGFFTTDIEEYSEQLEIVNSIVVKDSKNDILEAMSDEYQPNTMFITAKEAEKLDVDEISTSAIKSSEGIEEIENLKNGTVTFKTNFEEQRVVLLNEYNDNNWTVYVDGEKEAVYSGNYLLRAVKVPAGNHSVEFKYEPKYKLLFTKIAIGTAVVFILLWVSMKWWEKKLRLNNQN
ncbi:YfhO family protein [Enterococcus sp. LJL128]